MKRKARKQLELLQRRRQVAERCLEGWTQREIAEHLGVAQASICQDLKQIRAQWRASAVRDFEAARALELAKLDHLERAAWAAFERSQKPLQTAVVSGQNQERQTRRSVKNQHGDPRFLEIVQKCLAQRRTLLGLEAAPREEKEDDDGDGLDRRRAGLLTLVAALRERRPVTAAGA